ncbi:MAG: glycosyltransferase 87 family protein, partial [Acidobacteriota bacterium]|nr:glycosyltransferase 87 family protein [Acidobacteriota bacterium]
MHGRRAALPAVLLAGAAALILALLFAARVSHKMPDLAVYWTAAARARGAEPLYRAEDGHYQFKYLPAFAVLTAPGARVSLETAKAVWFVASVALLVALVSLSLAMLPQRRRAGWVLVTLTVVVMLKFYGHELVLGQMNALFAVLVAAA